MIGRWSRAGGEIITVLFQYIDCFINNIVNVKNGVVVSINQLLLRTGLDFVGIAGWRKFLKLRRIAVVIGRTVAADGMQYNHAVAFQIINVLFQSVEQDFIVAFTVNTLPRRFSLVIFWCGTRSHAFAATVVIVPQNVNSCPLNNVEHAFLMLRQFLVVVRARHIREHTGHRYCRCRSAGCRAGK